ncbi:MAG TPA: ABC transporter substrate-binding protein [bacterium]|jgi:peptide/nickel transport system substrate-binding protein
MVRYIACLVALLMVVGLPVAYDPKPVAAQGRDPLTVVVALGADASTNDPSYAGGASGYIILNQLFEPLVGRNDNMDVQAVLAESWRTVGLLTWQFKLRRGVKFHSGAPFDANAVKFSFDRLYEVNRTGRTVFDIPLSLVKVVDQYTVNVVTKTPVANLPYYLWQIYMIDPTVYGESKSPITDKSSGTGPFKFVEWVRDDHFTMVANKDYWGGAPQISRVTFRPIPEDSTRLSELLTGAVDIIQNVPPDQVSRIATATTQLVVAPGGRAVHAVLASNRPPFNDVRVRRAVNYAVDVRTMNRQLLGGYGEPYGAVAMPPRDNPKLKPYPYDPQKAKALMAEAGYAAGFAVTLQTPRGNYLKDAETAQAIAGYLENVGIKVTVEVLAPSVFRTITDQDRYKEMALRGDTGYYDGQGELAWALPEIARNGWENKEFRQVFNTLVLTFDPARRKALILKAQEIVFNEAPWLFLWRQPGLWGTNKRVNWRARRDERIFLKTATVR